MAQVKMISVVYERKINLGDYNSAHVGITLWADLDPGEDDQDVVTKELYEEAKTQVKNQILPIVANHRAKVEETFLALPVEVQSKIMEGYNANQGLD